MNTKLSLSIAALMAVGEASAQLLESLQSFGKRVPVDDVSQVALRGREGPKDLLVDDLDGDGKMDFVTSNLDGTLAVVYGRGDDDFDTPLFLQTASVSLRGLVGVDFDGDTRLDLAVVDPFAGCLFLFMNEGGRSFSAPLKLMQWKGVRTIATGDFDGDEKVDIALAGASNGGDTHGLRILFGDGDGGVREQLDPTVLDPAYGAIELNSRPVHELVAFRNEGGLQDLLIFGHADAKRAVVYYVGENEQDELEALPMVNFGQLIPISQLSDLEVTRLGGPTAVYQDLLAISKIRGTISIYRGRRVGGNSHPWMSVIPEEIQVAGGPRSVEAADMNGDGWTDLVVALRNYDRVVIFENKEGEFELVSELPTGSSPRVVKATSLNDDEVPDLLVMNRSSLDVSVLLSEEDGGTAGVSKQTYSVDGQVVSLKLKDLNGDERDDVVQLHAASGEVSVRLSEEGGVLAQPAFYRMGQRPIDFLLEDFNEDGFLDVVVASLGGVEPSTLSVRLGDGAGGFGEVNSITDQEGQLFALVAGDFDGDDNLDLAVGYFDCRVVFYRGDGEGGFERKSVHEFAYEARAMTVGDFDDDGDLDLAGSGAGGSVVVFTNQGDFMSERVAEVQRFDVGGKTNFPSITASDLDGDDDLDLTVGVSAGFVVLKGGEGATFSLNASANINVPFPTTDSVVGDFDDDGVDDLASACRILSCVTILKGGENGLEPVITVSVPSSELIATGDIDGDGKADLLGTGSFLWTALSGPGADVDSQMLLSALEREKLPYPVINEVLPDNKDVEVAGGGDPDVVELYHGGSEPVSIGGWRVELSASSENNFKEYRIPDETMLEPGGRLILRFQKRSFPAIGLQTGFKLPSEGGILKLISDAEVVVDEVTYPDTPEDTSWSRFQDGFASFAFNGIPDPGMPNLDNGAIDPDVDFDGLGLDAYVAGGVMRVSAEATDDFGVLTLTLKYRVLTDQPAEEQELLLFDDGLHDDGEAADGVFSNYVPRTFAAGEEIEFFFTAVDLTGGQTSSPGASVFAPLGIETDHHLLRIGEEFGAPGLQISEVVSKNKTGIVEENGKSADWIEIRNTSENTISLDRYYLANWQFPEDEDVFWFPEGSVLEPGDYLIIFADGDPEDGPLHAPFRLDSDGESIFVGVAHDTGTTTLLSYVDVPQLQFDQSWSQLGLEGEEFLIGDPTPGGANGIAGLNLRKRDDGFFLFYQTRKGIRYELQGSTEITPGSWGTLLAEDGDGIEATFSTSAQSKQFFRLMKQ